MALAQSAPEKIQAIQNTHETVEWRGAMIGGWVLLQARPSPHFLIFPFLPLSRPSQRRALTLLGFPA